MQRTGAFFCGLIVCALMQFAGAATVTVTGTTKYQQIDGFGFFGPMLNWWSSSNASAFWTSSWLDLIVDTLGMTIWRNEYYSEESNQDADWAKQKPFVQALKAKADASGVDIKFIFTVWTPPSQWKSNGSLKNGGNLLATRYVDFGNWLADGVKNYADAGIILYALSPQNEPLFEEPYNSCVYTAAAYRDMLKSAGPVVHAAYPDVKICGPEHMLFGVGKDWDYNNLDPTKAVFDDTAASHHLDLWACHGYGADGQTPAAASTEALYWRNAWQRVGQDAGRRLWMTETSGYGSAWDDCMDYALSIHAALYYGHVSGWVHWYGAGDLVTQTALTAKGTVLKHFARFIPPGAQRIAASAGADSNAIFVTAYQAGNDFAAVVINAGTGSMNATVAGEGLPGQLHAYQSTATERCVDKGNLPIGSLVIPGRSIVTLTGALSTATGTDAQITIMKNRHEFGAVWQNNGPVLSYDMRGRIAAASQWAGRGIYMHAVDRGKLTKHVALTPK